jgi:hypothetical protein
MLRSRGWELNPHRVEISPEVLTNSKLFVRLDIPNKREAIVNISLMKDWRFLPNNEIGLLSSNQPYPII